MKSARDELDPEWEIGKDDRDTLARYDEYRTAADVVAGAFKQVPYVRRVALFGSIASRPRVADRRRRHLLLHVPKDLDLAVWIDRLDDLNGLRKLMARTLTRLFDERQIGVASHQVDVFLLDAATRYLGRLCHYGECPKHKPECRVPGCGATPFLKQHENFRFDADESLDRRRIVVLYERCSSG